MIIGSEVCVCLGRRCVSIGRVGLKMIAEFKLD